MNENKENFVKKYKYALIRLTVIVLVIMGVVGGLFFKGYTSAKEKYEEYIKELEEKVEELSDPVAVYTNASTEVDIQLISSKIQSIGELATIEYLYTDAGKFEDPKQLFGKNIPFTTKSFIAKWDGIIKAGVDIGKVTVDVNNLEKEIMIHIPKAQIISHEIDSNSIETLDQKNGLFNPLKVEDVREFDKVSKDAMEKRAVENGILDKAVENAKEIIESFVNNDVVKEQQYEIIFNVIE